MLWKKKKKKDFFTDITLGSWLVPVSAFLKKHNSILMDTTNPHTPDRGHKTDTMHAFKHQHFAIPQCSLLYPFALCITPVCRFTPSSLLSALQHFSAPFPLTWSPVLHSCTLSGVSLPAALSLFSYTAFSHTPPSLTQTSQLCLQHRNVDTGLFFSWLAIAHPPRSRD